MPIACEFLRRQQEEKLVSASFCRGPRSCVFDAAARGRFPFLAACASASRQWKSFARDCRVIGESGSASGQRMRRSCGCIFQRDDRVHKKKKMPCGLRVAASFQSSLGLVPGRCDLHPGDRWTQVGPVADQACRWALGRPWAAWIENWSRLCSSSWASSSRLFLDLRG